MNTANQAPVVKKPVAHIIAAARSCYLQAGLDKTGMREVAAAAGVARSTLYRYFPTRDELLVAVIKEDMLELGLELSQRLENLSDPAEHIVEGLVLAIDEIPKRPLLNAVFAAEAGSQSQRVVWSSPAIVQLGNDFMSGVIGPAIEQQLLRQELRPEVLTEWVYRVLLSFLTLPSYWIKNDEQLKATLHALLIPVLLKQ